MATMSLFAAQIAAEEAAEKEATRDHVGERLIALGYVANEFVLHLNSHIGVKWQEERPYPWGLPSRLMRWPVEVCRYRRDLGYCYNEVNNSQLGLAHPLLGEHPLVLKLRADGFELADDGVLYDSAGDQGGWGHACDLATDADWKDLIDTKRFTCDHAIFSAVSFRIGCKLGQKNGLSVKSARGIMAALGSVEPSDRKAAIMQFSKPSQREKAWPVNRFNKNKEAEAWGIIHAIEDGWVAFKGDHLGWTAEGRERYAKG